MLLLMLFGILLPVVRLQSAPLPQPDGNLHIFSLPIGQGDANLIQCPDGTLAIYDWGSSNAASSQFWAAPELITYLGDQMGSIQNIVATHQHSDHYDLMPDTFPDLSQLTSLQNIYISCTYADVAAGFGDWIAANGAEGLIREFNNGGQCGPVGPACETVDLCPNDQDVVTQIMAANLGECTGDNKNMDSIVAKIMYGQFSVLLPGDFEDKGTSESEDGPQKWMADFYGTELNVVVNQVAHHGAATNANKRIWTDTIAAPIVWTSGDAWYSYGHPRCEAVENYKPFLCTPLETDPASPAYCGDNIFDPSQLQQTYTCGNDSDNFFEVNDNTKAFYSTTPQETVMHLVEVATDGTRWGVNYRVEPATP